MKKKVLIMTAYYLPSVKGGGPIQSIKNLVDNLSDKIDFYILTADRDLGDDKSFSNIIVDEWVKVGNAKVFYTDTSKLNLIKTIEIINSIEYDTMYLNSFFNYKFSIVPILLKKFKRISSKKIVVAPRGEFYQGALGKKSIKKKMFIMSGKIFGLYNNITWHATTELERKQIKNLFNDELNIIIANNLTANYSKLRYEKKLRKEKDELKVVFVSRVHPKKNLKKAIELLQKVKGNIEFRIYGPIEDKNYWNKCLDAMKILPKGVEVFYEGIASREDIMEIFNKNHIFFFPTLGENYGHVISEALIGGCPVIISDQTPWTNLEENQAGWSIKLTDEDNFIETIQKCVDLNDEEYRVFSKKAFDYGKRTSNKANDINNTFDIFQ